MDISGYPDLMCLLLEKNITFSMNKEDEESYQEAVERIILDSDSLAIEDKPANPIKVITSEKAKTLITMLCYT